MGHTQYNLSAFGAMKSLLTLVAFVGISLGVRAQVTIEQCYDSARVNYPLIVGYDLIDKTKHYSLRNASLAYAPTMSLMGQATYQSQTISLPFAVPGVDPIPKEQYKIAVDLQQAIWDGGLVRAQRKNIIADADVQKLSLDVDLYAIRDRVNNLFFGILLLDKQLSVNDLYNEELWRNFRNIESYVQGGLSNAADLDAVSVEIIANNQRRVAIGASRKAYMLMLGQLVGFEVDSIVEPVIQDVDQTEINRPELTLFESQQRLADSKLYAINAKGMPRLGLFAQGAYGNPGLNLLKAGFTPYAIGGVRLTWDFSGWYSSANDKKLIELQKRNIDAARQTFLFNTELELKQNRGEIERIEAQIVDDDRIIALRDNIKRSAQAKVEGGTMTVNEMMREVTAQNEAILAKQTRLVELLLEQYNLKYRTNN